jgi:hypothetical protein
MAWGLVAGATIATVGGSLLADDHGAEGANNAAADSTRLQTQIAQDQWARYKQMYSPLEEAYVTDAQNYDSPENYAKAAGDASATVSSQFSKARDRLSRTPGLDPSTPGAQASLVGLDLAQAASDATQQNAARQKVKDTAYARKTDAISLGKGLPATASSALGVASQNSLAQAQFGQNQANNQAAAFGRVTDRVFSSPTVSNWLGNVGVKAGTAMNLQNNGGFGTGNDFGNQDLGAFL